MSKWPKSSHLARDADRFTLILAAHPQCPCTRATIDGLEHVLAGAGGRLAAYVLVMTPSDAEEGWQKTDIWSAAERIAGVQVVSDRDAALAQVFGARTSGQTLLYDPGGNLVFRGGLTASRGHAGPSLGQQSILSLLHGRPAEVAETEVFGCALTARTDVSPHEN